jgi:DNA-binding CsgD family transcriptional regulator/tetratricopeptide (TPR) repeat protein
MRAQPLLERDRDLCRLAAALEQASAGHGHIVLVSGEAGIGKTTFVEHFRADCAGKACVVTGHCDPLFTPTPLGPLYDIARQTNGKLLALLESHAPRAALFSSMLGLVGGSDQATVVVIEDIHWADEATLDLVKYLGRRIASTRILLVLTYRDDEVAGHPSLRPLLGDLAASKSTQRIELSRLSKEAVRTLIADRPVDACALHRQTSGNPFYVTEVLSSGTGGVPATVRDAVLARAARLGPRCRAVLDAAAVIGSRIDPAMLERVSGKAADGLAECVKVGVLEVDGGGIAFRHELAREAVLGDIDPARRRDLSRLALDALQRGHRRSDLALLVQYAAGAGDSAAVVEYGVAAAQAATVVGAHRQAAAHYARVLEHAANRPDEERAGYCEAYAEECALIDELAEAERGRRLAIELWRQAGNRLKEGENLAELAWPLVRSGRNAAAEQTSRQAIAVLEGLPPSRQLANAYRIQAHLTMLDRDIPVAVRLGNKAIELAEHFGDKLTIAAAENVIGSGLLVSGHEMGRDHLQRSIALGRELGLDSVVGNGLMNSGASYGEIYHLADAERHLAEGIAYTAERDLDYANHYMHAWLALVRFYQGRWTEAAEIATALVARPNVSVISRIVGLVALGRVRARRGDADVASVLDEALALATQTGTLQRIAPVRAARAEAAWLAGDRARAAAEAAVAYPLATMHCHRWFTGELAFWRQRGGETIELPTWAAPPFVAQLEGDWRQAAAAWEALGCVYEQARALAEGDAEAQIAALEIFSRLGAAPAAAALRQRLRGAGMRKIPRGPRESTRQNAFGLTTRELQILDCLSTGLTNNGIGAKLHVSPKTVDHHVSSVLSKLGAASRGEAARIARAEHLLEAK